MEPSKPKVTKVKITTHTHFEPEAGGYYWQTQRNSPGLLFSTAEPSDEQLAAIVADESVRKLIGPLVVVKPYDNGVALHGDIGALPNPDRATQNDVVHYAQNGVLKSLKVLQRFQQCREPMRDLLGCSSCEFKGVPCLSGEAHRLPSLVPGLAETTTDSDALDSLEDRKTTIAGHEYVSPVLLAPEGENFIKSFRNPAGIDWDAEEEQRSRRRRNATVAAGTRKFIKTECGVCPARKGGCQQERWCSGAYPSDVVLTANVLEKCLPYMDLAPRGGEKLELWQQYAIMRLAGTESKKRYLRRHVLLGGLDREGVGLTVRIVASKKPVDTSYFTTTNWEWLRVYFPELPEKEGGRYTERPTDHQLALYFAALEERRFGPVLRGFHGYVQDYIGWLRVHTYDPNQIELGRAFNAWVQVGYHATCGDWTGFYNLFKSLPGKRRESR